jgi:hypothetical protein
MEVPRVEPSSGGHRQRDNPNQEGSPKRQQKQAQARKWDAAPATDEAPERREIPLDLAVEHLAVSLRRNNPELDEFAAERMARKLLEEITHAEEGEDGHGSGLSTFHVDTHS